MLGFDFRIQNFPLGLAQEKKSDCIFGENRLSLSKVMNNSVRACIAGNAKNQQNRPTSPRDFLATAGTKNSRWVPKLVLIHVLSGNIHLGGIGNGRENFVLDFRGISLSCFILQISCQHPKAPYSFTANSIKNL